MRRFAAAGMDLDNVFPRVFVGSFPEDTRDIAQLKREYGVSAVLNLQTDDDFDYLEVDWEWIRAAYRHERIVVRRVPVRDFDTEDLRRMLPRCVEVLEELLAAGHTVYLHCTAGVGRSPSVAVAYLHWVEGWTLDRAYEYVRMRRPSQPNLKAIEAASRDRLTGEPGSPTEEDIL
jgi:protein tyrosine/serine phosphatase